MQRPIDWDDLHILLMVAQAGSLARAGATLGVHRSTVLRRIERLEARIGMRLFDRTPNGLALTAMGERLTPHAERMADQVVDLLRSADVDHGRPAGTIRIAATYNLAFGLLPRILDRFNDRYPEIRVEVTGTADGYSAIHPDQFDLALRTLEHDITAHDQMVGLRLGKLPLAIYGSKSYFSDRPIPKSVKGLSRYRLLLGCGALSNVSAFKWLEDRSKPGSIAYRASSMLLILAAVREGIGLSCLPRYMGDGDNQIVRAFDVPESLCADLWILRHAHHRNTARMRVFADFLATELKQRMRLTTSK
jgi:DNA-binding transcriptional LysR family regulator